MDSLALDPARGAEVAATIRAGYAESAAAAERHAAGHVAAVNQRLDAEKVKREPDAEALATAKAAAQRLLQTPLTVVLKDAGFGPRTFSAVSAFGRLTAGGELQVELLDKGAAAKAIFDEGAILLAGVCEASKHRGGKWANWNAEITVRAQAEEMEGEIWFSAVQGQERAERVESGAFGNAGELQAWVRDRIAAWSDLVESIDRTKGTYDAGELQAQLSRVMEIV